MPSGNEHGGEFAENSANVQPKKPKPLSSLTDIRNTIAQLLSSGKTVFVRWSTDPVKDQVKWGGQSKDSVSGQLHEGLSAVPIDEEWLTYSDEAFRRRLNEYSFLQMKRSSIKPWIVVGEQHENFYGDKLVDSDGYPVIKVHSAIPINKNTIKKIQ